jgi:hypothetical protein
MTQSPKPPTAAQRASDANHDRQTVDNVRDGRKTPPPRDPEAARRAYEERHGSPNHRR